MNDNKTRAVDAPVKAVEAASTATKETAKAETKAAKAAVDASAKVAKSTVKTTKTATKKAVKTPKKTVRKATKAKAAKSNTPPRKGTKIMTNAQTKKVQDTIQTMTSAGNEAFREGFEKSLKSVNEINAFSKDNMDAVMASATAAGKGIETLNANAVAFAKKSMEDTVSATKAMTTAKSVQDMIEVQADFMKSSMDAYLAEINKATDLYAGAVKSSLKPLNDRVAATVEMVQSQR
ncbi:phasin family protein [Hyphobacterium marinum]|uniref:TIGR01841 family phasin n=1 Tax=Hyphobacterium marinum TaxID=3116574 RepID=A0ABU7LZ87_9PROT|nr:TIGR01841 family phasin [Hyphobacterium sp. Y6023]MEE2566840.1 TIGR01841 family phasin [Hyphobacterium sp. Y6023]